MPSFAFRTRRVPRVLYGARAHGVGDRIVEEELRGDLQQRQKNQYDSYGGNVPDERSHEGDCGDV